MNGRLFRVCILALVGELDQCTSEPLQFSHLQPQTATQRGRTFSRAGFPAQLTKSLPFPILSFHTSEFQTKLTWEINGKIDGHIRVTHRRYVSKPHAARGSPQDQKERHMGRETTCILSDSYVHRTRFLFYERGLTMKKHTAQSHYQLNLRWAPNKRK